MSNKWIAELPRACTAVQAPVRPVLPGPREFGWYWLVTEDIAFLTGEMIRRGKVFNVWKTRQFKAIEKLIGRDPLPFPAFNDEGLHGTFCKILSIEAICRDPTLTSDLLDAVDRLERASELHNSAADLVYDIPTEALDLLASAPGKIAHPTLRLGDAQVRSAIALGDMLGILKTDLKFRQSVSAKFSGSTSLKSNGRPKNWVSEFVAIHAADIYRTVFAGKITRSKSAGRPSFQSFLEDFCIGIPDAERADKRRLARRVWDGEYEGVPFAFVK